MLGSFVVIYLQFPEEEGKVRQYLAGLLITLISGYLWLLGKLGIVMWALHGCERKNKCVACHRLVVDTLSFIIYNDMTLK